MKDRAIRFLGISTLSAGVILAALCLILMQVTDSLEMAWVAVFAAAAGAVGNLAARKH